MVNRVQIRFIMQPVWPVWPTNLLIVDRFFTALSQILKTGKGASRELRKMFYGAITYLSMTILTRRWGRLARGLHKDRSMYKWKKQPFSSVHNLRLGIKNLGFKEVAPWTWEPPEDLKGIFTGDDRKLCLDPESRQPLELQLHILRKMFRVNSFLNWCNHKKKTRCCLVSKSWWSPLSNFDFRRNRLDKHEKSTGLKRSHTCCNDGVLFVPGRKFFWLPARRLSRRHLLHVQDCPRYLGTRCLELSSKLVSVSLTM